MSDVYIEPCTGYDLHQIVQILRPIVFDLHQKTGLFQQCDRVFLKPNLITDRTPQEACTTHPVFTEAVIVILLEYGCKITIGDSCSGRYQPEVLRNLYEVTGYADLAKRYMITLNEDCSVMTKNKIAQCSIMQQADYVLNLCKLKAHSYTTFTGAVKNCYGSVPGEVKKLQHGLHPTRKSFARYLLDVCDTLHPAVSFMDGITGMQGNGPTNGERYDAGFIAVATNPYALDRMVTDLLRIPTTLLPLDEAARKAGKYDAITLISSCAKEELYRNGFRLPDSVKNKAGYPRFLIDRCVGCGKCVSACPQQTIRIEEHKAVFSEKNCIRCYCCQEVCPKNAVKVD